MRRRRKVWINPFNGSKIASKAACIAQMERDYGDQIDTFGISAEQIMFNARNRYPLGRTHGRSVLSGKPTSWNLEAGRYERFANEREREIYRQSFLDRMRKRYGKDHLLDSPDQQKKMIAGRRIAGEYTFKDGGKRGFVGQEERAFLEYMDGNGWPSEDIHSPAPQVFPFRMDGKLRHYYPDFWIESINLIVEIKGEKHKGWREREAELERTKDAILKTSGYDFVKVEDRDYEDLSDKIEEIQAYLEED